MNNKGFAETHTSIETPNDVDVAKKPLKTLKKRVDINILKYNQSFFKEFFHTVVQLGKSLLLIDLDIVDFSTFFLLQD